MWQPGKKSCRFCVQKKVGCSRKRDIPAEEPGAIQKLKDVPHGMAGRASLGVSCDAAEASDAPPIAGSSRVRSPPKKRARGIQMDQEMPSVALLKVWIPGGKTRPPNPSPQQNTEKRKWRQDSPEAEEVHLQDTLAPAKESGKSSTLCDHVNQTHKVLQPLHVVLLIWRSAISSWRTASTGSG